MTVQELIEHLNRFPPETRVVLPGYEGGYNDVSTVQPIQLLLDAHRDWWMGRHDEVEEHGEKAVLLEGKNELAEDE